MMSGLPSWTIPSGHLDKLLAPCKGSQNSLGFWIPCCEFQIPGTRYPDCLSVEPGFKIATVGGFPDYLSCIQDFKVQNPDSTSKKIPDSGFYN